MRYYRWYFGSLDSGKDREALQRLKRFLDPSRESASSAMPFDEHEIGSPQTIIGRVEQLFFADVNRKWTVPAALAFLKHEKFPLVAHKPEATLGQVFARLQRRGKIRLVRRGSGRTPNVFRAVPPQPKEGDSEGQNERATQGQPVAVQ